MEYKGVTMDEDEISIVEANEMKNEVKIDTPYLPEEIWFRIFFFVAANRQQLLKAITVCKWWKRLLSDNGIWLSIFKNKFLNYQEESLRPLTQPIIDPRFTLRTQYIRKSKLAKNWESCNHSFFRLQAHRGHVSTVSIDGILSRLVSGGGDKTVKIWDILKRKCITTISNFTGGVNCLQFDDKKIVAGTASHYIAILDFNTTQKIMKLKGHRHQVYDLVYHGDLVASCSADRTVKLWDLRTKGCVRNYTGYTDTVPSIEFDGKRLFSGNESSIRELDLSSDKVLKQWTLKELRNITNLKILGNETAVTGGDDRNIGLWNLKDNSLISVLEAQNYVMCLDVNEYGILYNSYGTLGFKPHSSYEKDAEKFFKGQKPGDTNEWIQSMDVDFESRRVVGGSNTGFIHVWDFLPASPSIPKSSSEGNMSSPRKGKH